MIVAYYIGANIGQFCDVLLERCDKIIAVEPNPTIFEQLKERWKNEERIICINKALSTTNEPIDFFIPNNPSEHEIATCEKTWTTYGRFKKSFDAGYTTIKVDCVTLDELISTYGDPSLIKLDVEGYEKNIIYAMKRYYKNCLFIYEWTDEIKVKSAECLNRLGQLGWSECQIMHGDEPLNLSSDWRDWHDIQTGVEFLIARKWKGQQWGDVYVK